MANRAVAYLYPMTFVPVDVLRAAEQRDELRFDPAIPQFLFDAIADHNGGQNPSGHMVYVYHRTVGGGLSHEGLVPITEKGAYLLQHYLQVRISDAR